MNKELDTLGEVIAELVASKGRISDCSNSYAGYREGVKEHFLEKYKIV
ncbi:hypothetical protein U732_1266 [Clostridium argentinense CDC 2741]|uniref:Uncharacterized protein n=1 Tax=Clostridium argentinense CDC 2741 TaxID=1418104 RepID=A0A0C1U5G2_9CLOT|nr:hypothetical protein [Clostridium argentinense]KIE46963.1 hypothetical protein U732_1266 [Clostridium argentinense CDC 2741]